MELETAITFTDTLIFAQTGGHLSDLQQAMLRASWSMQRQSYDQIASTYGYSATYLKHDVGPKLWRLLSDVLGEKVNKTNFRAAIERRFQRESVQPPEPVEPPAAQISAVQTSAAPVQDWEEPIDVSCFYGRQQVLTELTQWVTERCRLIVLLGMGGMGKTTLAAKLAQQFAATELVETAPAPAFQFIIWRSLRNALSIEILLTDLLQVLSQRQLPQPAAQPDTVAAKIKQLLHYLRLHRCLIVLDNVETVLSDASSEADVYGLLLQQVGETVHQSCLVLTSREKPKAVAILEAATLPVRSLQLTGLSPADGQEIFQLKGSFQGTDAEWQQLIAAYAGNPLALKMAATTIQTLFAGNIGEFLAQETFVFGTIRYLLEQQFNRLSPVEKKIMYWLAINREAASFADLRSDLLPTVTPQALLEGLETLEYRSLVERNQSLFALQPVISEYVTDRLIEQVVQEIQAGLKPASSQQKPLCTTHALLKAQSKDYIREAQSRLILQPILQRLVAAGSTALAMELLSVLAMLQGSPSSEIGYAGGNLLNLLFQQQSSLSNCDLSRLAIWQADFRNIQLRNVDFSDTDLSHSTFAETLGIVFTVAFSPDGLLLATGDAEGGLRLWHRTDGRLLLNLTGHSGWVWSVAFSPDGQILASGSSDKTVRLWDVATGRCLQVLEGHTGSIWSVALSPSHPEAQLLASGSDESSIKLWNVATGACIQSLSGHVGRVLAVALGQQTLASGGEDGSVRLWSLPTGGCQSLLVGHTDRVWSVALSPDGCLLASGSADGTIKLWDIVTGTCLKTLSDHQGRVRSVAFSPDGQFLASSSDDQTIRLWHLQTGECQSVLQGHSNVIFSIAFADGQTLASGSADQTVRFWQTPSGRCLKTVKGYTNSVFSVAFSPNGQMVASSSTDQTIRLWTLEVEASKAGNAKNAASDNANGITPQNEPSNESQPLSQRYQILSGHQGWVTSVAFHPNGDLLASASADQTVRLWSVRRQSYIRTLQGHQNWVQSVAFSPTGNLLASGGDDRILRLWSIETGQCLKTLTGHESWIWSVRFSPNGICASSSDDQTIRLWSVDGECLQVLQGHTQQIQTIAFSPDGRLLASGSGDETVRLWDVNSGECLQILPGHHNNVWSVDFSPDGQFLASGSLDQTVRLWDLKHQTCVQVLAVPNRSVRSSIRFNPVAEPRCILATGSQGGSILLWDVATGERMQSLIPDRPYQGTNIARVTGLTDAQKEALKALGAVED